MRHGVEEMNRGQQGIYTRDAKEAVEVAVGGSFWCYLSVLVLRFSDAIPIERVLLFDSVTPCCRGREVGRRALQLMHGAR